MPVNVAHCDSRGWKRLTNKSNWDTIRKTGVCKLLDKAGQRWTKPTDGEEDVKEHSVWDLFPAFTISGKQTNKGAIWINSTVELMAPYAYFITDAHPQSQCVSCQLRQCSFVIFNNVSFDSSALKSEDKKSLWSVFFYPWTIEWGEPGEYIVCSYRHISSMNHRTPTI